MRKFTCFTLGLLLACAVTVNAQEQKNDQEGYKFTDIKRLPTTMLNRRIVPEPVGPGRLFLFWNLKSCVWAKIRSACLRCMSYGTPIMPKEINMYG